jgi:hypothetical protein
MFGNDITQARVKALRLLDQDQNWGGLRRRCVMQLRGAGGAGGANVNERIAGMMGVAFHADVNSMCFKRLASCSLKTRGGGISDGISKTIRNSLSSENRLGFINRLGRKLSL